MDSNDQSFDAQAAQDNAQQQPALGNTPQQKDGQQKERPDHVIRDGSLKATLWLREGKFGSYFMTDLAKTITDRDGNLKDVRSFTRHELPRIGELASHAHQYAIKRQREINPIRKQTERAGNSAPQKESPEIER